MEIAQFLGLVHKGCRRCGGKSSSFLVLPLHAVESDLYVQRADKMSNC